MPPVGSLLQTWRKARQLSQLALADKAEVSPRHLCFVETGRARPSREMVLVLANALDVPLRERNAMLHAAGFAPVYAESPLAGEQLAPIRAAVDAILKQQEPHPAVVLNRAWDITQTNRAATRFFGFLMKGRSVPGPANVLRTMLHPKGAKPYVVNWEAVARALIGRLHREALGGPDDAAIHALRAEVLAYPGVAEAWKAVGDAPLSPVVPVSFAREGKRFDYFSAVTTLGTPQDVTVQEIRIECFFPV